VTYAVFIYIYIHIKKDTHTHTCICKYVYKDSFSKWDCFSRNQTDCDCLSTIDMCTMSITEEGKPQNKIKKRSSDCSRDNDPIHTHTRARTCTHKHTRAFSNFTRTRQAHTHLHKAHTHSLKRKSPRKPWRKWILVEDEVCGQSRVGPIDKLDEACTNMDDRMMFVQHRSGDRVMSYRGFGQIS